VRGNFCTRPTYRRFGTIIRHKLHHQVCGKSPAGVRTAALQLDL